MPVIVEDTGLYFNACGGMPGPYVKSMFKAMENDGLWGMVSGKEDKTGYS